MTVENQVYGVVDWMKCAFCGVTQPSRSLVKRIGNKRVDAQWNEVAPLTDWICSDPAKCAEWERDMRRERAEFARTHPDLHPTKNEIISGFAPGTKGLK